MKYLLTLLLIAVVATPLRTQTTDSSSLVFDETVVHEYALTFYVENWEDMLVYNYENGEEYMPARLECNGMVFDSIGVRYKGNSSYMMSRGTKKKPFKFRFDKYRDDQRLYGLKKLNFSNCVKDPSFLREMLAYHVLREYVPASRTAYANITIEGELIGLYVQVEQVDKVFLKRHFPDNDYNLYKSQDNGATLEYRGADKESYRDEYELQTNEDEDDWTRFITMIELLNNTPDGSFNATLEQWIDFPTASRLLAFNMLVSNFDSYTGSGRNFYFYDEEESGRFYMIPWDLNESFGAYSNRWNVISQSIITASNLSERPLNRRVLADEQLRQAYLRSMAEMLDGAAAYDSLAVKAAEYRALIDDHVQADTYKLYSYQNFIDNVDREVVAGLNERIPGVLSLLSERGSEVRSQLGVYTAVQETPAVLSDGIASFDLWPNPAVDHAGIRFQLETAGTVTLMIRNLLGQTVRSVDLGMQNSGWYNYSTSLDGLQPGSYIYQVTLEESGGGQVYSQPRKLLIVR